MMKPPPNPPLDGLLDLACRNGVDIRPTLLRVLTDLYVQKPSHSAAEETQYIELALGLIGSVDAPTRAAVAASLARYPGAPAAILGKLGHAEASPAEPETESLVEQFFSGSADDRRKILMDLVAATPPPRAPAPVAGELIRLLETAALQRNAGEFSRVLQRALSVSPTIAERITRDPSGEPLVVAAKALGMPAATVQRILLFLNPAIGESVARVHDLSRLFDDLTPQAASGMAENWRASGSEPQSQRKPAYEPVTWDSERRSARSLATSTVRRRVSRSDDLPSRGRSGR